jgi:hypothetical protein
VEGSSRLAVGATDVPARHAAKSAPALSAAGVERGEERATALETTPTRRHLGPRSTAAGGVWWTFGVRLRVRSTDAQALPVGSAGGIYYVTAKKP